MLIYRVLTKFNVRSWAIYIDNNIAVDLLKRQPAAALDADGGLLRTRLYYYSHHGNDSFPWGERYIPMVGIRAKSVSGERRIGYRRMQRQPRAYYNFNTTD